MIASWPLALLSLAPFFIVMQLSGVSSAGSNLTVHLQPRGWRDVGKAVLDAGDCRGMEFKLETFLMGLSGEACTKACYFWAGIYHAYILTLQNHRFEDGGKSPRDPCFPPGTTVCVHLEPPENMSIKELMAELVAEKKKNDETPAFTAHHFLKKDDKDVQSFTKKVKTQMQNMGYLVCRANFLSTLATMLLAQTRMIGSSSAGKSHPFEQVIDQLCLAFWSTEQIAKVEQSFPKMPTRRSEFVGSGRAASFGRMSSLTKTSSDITLFDGQWTFKEVESQRPEGDEAAVCPCAMLVKLTKVYKNSFVHGRTNCKIEKIAHRHAILGWQVRESSIKVTEGRESVKCDAEQEICNCRTGPCNFGYLNEAGPSNSAEETGPRDEL